MTMAATAAVLAIALPFSASRGELVQRVMSAMTTHASFEMKASAAPAHSPPTWKIARPTGTKTIMKPVMRMMALSEMIVTDQDLPSTTSALDKIMFTYVTAKTRDNIESPADAGAYFSPNASLIRTSDDTEMNTVIGAMTSTSASIDRRSIAIISSSERA